MNYITKDTTDDLDIFHPRMAVTPRRPHTSSPVRAERLTMAGVEVTHVDGYQIPGTDQWAEPVTWWGDYQIYGGIDEPVTMLRIVRTPRKRTSDRHLVQHHVDLTGMVPPHVTDHAAILADLVAWVAEIEAVA